VCCLSARETDNCAGLDKRRAWRRRGFPRAWAGENGRSPPQRTATGALRNIGNHYLLHLRGIGMPLSAASYRFHPAIFMCGGLLRCKTSLRARCAGAAKAMAARRLRDDSEGMG